jgi:cation diffusion facilitator family transporter
MRAVFAALIANLGIAITKFIAFLFTGSASMLAESVHSVADTANELLLIVGRGRSSRPASEEHPFGFGRERYFYGFVVSVMLFTVGGAFSVYDGIHKIVNPEPVHAPLVALIVLLLSAVLEGFSFRTGIHEANQVRGNRSWPGFIRRTKAPELPVVLLEDLAALIGLLFAFTGVALSALTHDGRWDGAGSLAIGLLLATAAAILAVEMKSLLIGESASAESQQMIVAALEEGPEAVRVIHMRTVHISPDSLLVAAKIAVRECDTGTQVAAAIDAAEKRVRAALPIAKVIYLEPDIYRPSQVDHTDPSITAVVRHRPPLPPRRPTPHTPATPDNLSTPATPNTPSTPATPNTPNAPSTPATPKTPKPPSTPATPTDPPSLPPLRTTNPTCPNIAVDSGLAVDYRYPSTGNQPQKPESTRSPASQGTAVADVTQLPQATREPYPNCASPRTPGEPHPQPASHTLNLQATAPFSPGTAGARRVLFRSPGRGRSGWARGPGAGRDRPRRPAPEAQPVPSGRTPVTPG